jgi:formamidopyrimidine-DNA glycosylase
VKAVIASVRRRGKYLLVDLDRGCVLVHLGMSGQLRLQAESGARPSHTHVAFRLSNGQELRFVDPRRFGWVEACGVGGAFAQIADLGPDPLEELSATQLRGLLSESKASIKSVLLDQRKIAGLGNIYVCEALHAAKIHPAASAESSRGKAALLFKTIQSALRTGLENRGTSLRDYVDADGRAGTNSSALKVYGREGLPCLACGTAIARRVDGGRSSFYCPSCQPE